MECALRVVYRSGLNTALINDLKNNRENLVDAVLNVELMNKSTMYGYQVGSKGNLNLMPCSSFLSLYFQNNQSQPFLKVTLAVPRLIAASKRLLERNEVNVMQNWPLRVKHS